MFPLSPFTLPLLAAAIVLDSLVPVGFALIAELLLAAAMKAEE